MLGFDFSDVCKFIHSIDTLPCSNIGEMILQECLLELIAARLSCLCWHKNFITFLLHSKLVLFFKIVFDFVNTFYILS